MGFFLDVYLANIISIVPVMEQKAGTGLHGFKDTCLLEYIVRGRSFLKKKHWGRRTTGIKALITPEDTCLRTEAISQNKGLLPGRPKLLSF